MAPVAIKYIVSFSSQDDHHKVQNLLTGDGFKKWLSHPKEKSGRIEAVLQLKEPSILSYIDIGTHWCASIELKVGRSDWPQNTLYRTLVPTSYLMTAVESKMSKGFVKTKMFTSENFTPEVASEKWDRIQVILRQPYRKDIQYGLSFIRIKAAGNKYGSSEESDRNKTNDMTSPDRAIKSVVSIQKHFFGDKSESSESPDPVKSRLMKLAGSTENGSEQVGILSRTAKLVLSASESAGKYSPQARAGPSKSAKMTLFSEHLAQKYGSIFDEELDDFLSTLQLADIDLDKITIADLRHKFEKRKKRKLTTDEKKIFIQKCSDCICKLFDTAEESEDSVSPATVMGEASSSSSTPNSYSKSANKMYTTPSNSKRKIENETEVSRTVKTPRLDCDTDRTEGDLQASVTKHKVVKLRTPKSKAGTTLASQKSFINQVENMFLHTEQGDMRVPFAYKSLNIESETTTPSSGKKSITKFGKKGKNVQTSQCESSPAEKKDTCGLWLSKDKGPGLANTVPSPEKQSRVDARQTTPGGRGRGKKKHGGRTNSSSTGRGKSSANEVQPAPVYGKYVYCSSCKGNVPEQIFSDHFIACNRSDESSSMYSSINTSPPPRTSTAATFLNRSYTSPQANASDVYSAVDISDNSDVLIASDSSSLVECPLCGEFYEADIIIIHADVCASASELL